MSKPTRFFEFWYAGGHRVESARGDQCRWGVGTGQLGAGGLGRRRGAGGVLGAGGLQGVDGHKVPAASGAPAGRG